MPDHRFPYRWSLSDGYPGQGIERHGCRVFGTFICGGGSTMGYKLAGYDHIGGVEIDPMIANVYRTNHSPELLYEQDIREFAKRDDLPDELFDLDILDGSPPCSSFSMSGRREKDWRKEKLFREGQAVQRLDDLFFDFIDLAAKLRPKVVIAENVKGLIQGNAKSYVRRIGEALETAGYEVQLFLLNSATMGVPQKRERVFFLCRRKDLNLPPISIDIMEPPIPYGKIRVAGTSDSSFTDHDLRIWNNRIKSDTAYSDTLVRMGEVRSNWNSKFIHDEGVCCTIASTNASKLVSYSEPKRLTVDELKQCGTFPSDYDFCGVDPKYLIGMSVPPVMTAQVSLQVYLQWLKPLMQPSCN